MVSGRGVYISRVRVRNLLAILLGTSRIAFPRVGRLKSETLIPVPRSLVRKAINESLSEPEVYANKGIREVRVPVVIASGASWIVFAVRTVAVPDGKDFVIGYSLQVLNPLLDD